MPPPLPPLSLPMPSPPPMFANPIGAASPSPFPLAPMPAKHRRTNREAMPPTEPILSFLVSLLLSGWSKIREARKIREASSPVSVHPSLSPLERRDSLSCVTNGSLSALVATPPA
ncbi:hypothetical protein SEVIR_6G238383v4 [Setaria viridis]